MIKMKFCESYVNDHKDKSIFDRYSSTPVVFFLVPLCPVNLSNINRSQNVNESLVYFIRPFK